MKDSEILGSGNSRYMKSAISETATWEEFRAMLRAGTFPFDFNGINEAGFTQVGDALNKNNLLKDATAALLGGDANMVPDEALAALKGLIDKLDADSVGATETQLSSYTGTGVSGAGNPTKINFSKRPTAFVVVGQDNFTFGTESIVFSFFKGYATGSGAYFSVCVHSWSGNQLSFYTTTTLGAPAQANTNGVKYEVIAWYE